MNHGEVVQASLGYYINPLVSVMLGVVVLSERLRRLQWVAIGIATLAVVWLTFEYGHVPWVALVLAVSFALYGLLKKQADAPAVQSMVVEAGVLAPARAALRGRRPARRDRNLHRPWSRATPRC